MTDSDQTFWPEPLRRFVVSGAPNRIRVRPQGLGPGQLTLFIITGFAIVMSVSALFVYGVSGAGVISRFAAWAFTLWFSYVALVDGLRWFELERQPSGWRVRQGSWRWVRQTDTFDDTEVVTALLTQDLMYYGAYQRSSLDHVLIALVGKPTFGPHADPPPSIHLGDMFVLPRDVMDALCEVIKRSIPAAKTDG